LSESPSPPPFWGIAGSALFAAGAAGVAGAAALGAVGAAAGSLAFGAGVVAVGVGALAGVAAGALGVVVGVVLGVVVAAAAGVVGVLAGVGLVVPVLAEFLAAEPQPATTSVTPTAPRLNNARGVLLRGLPVGGRAPSSIGNFKIRVFGRIMGSSLLSRRAKVALLRSRRVLGEILPE